MKTTEPQFILRSRIQADLILPRPSLDSRPKTIIAPGEKFVADEYLLSAVCRHIFIEAQLPSQKHEDSIETSQNATTAQPCINPNSLKLPIPPDFFYLWYEKYNRRGCRAGELLKIVEKHHASFQKTLGENRQAQSIRLGKLIRACANSEGEWIVESKRSGHSTKFYLRKSR